AGRVRKTALRRQAMERADVELLAPPVVDGAGASGWTWDLHETLGGLPAKYPQPIVLCYLEGRTNEETAQQLEWPVRTLKVRLMRAREMLRARLVRRGIAISATALSAALTAQAGAALPAGLAAALLAARAAGPGAAGAWSAQAGSLADGVLGSMG